MFISRVFSETSRRVCQRVLSASQSPQHYRSLDLQSPDKDNGTLASVNETESSKQSEDVTLNNESGLGSEAELSWDEKVDAIENFAKALLDVADNLRMTFSLDGKDKFSKIHAWNVLDESVPVMDTLYECLQVAEIAEEMKSNSFVEEDQGWVVLQPEGKNENDELEINNLEEDEFNFNAKISGSEPQLFVQKFESSGFKDVIEAVALICSIGGLSIICIIIGGSEVLLIWSLVCVIGIIYLILFKRAYLD